MESINTSYTISDINIGRGSFSNVFLGSHKLSGFDVAIKKINTKKLKSMNKNFINEINLIKDLDHPHIINTHDIFNTQNHLYIVLEYCKNGTLHSFLDTRPLKEVHVNKFFSQIISALKYLYDKKILHRDLKPQNILLDNNNNIKLTDFDFAKFFNDDELLKTICGTPLYMAPEIIKYKEYNNKSDIWSLGIILYQMITGKHPYKAKTHYELVKKIESEHIIIPSKFDISQECYNIIHILLQKNPADRINWIDLFNHPWINMTIINTNNYKIKSINTESSIEIDNDLSDVEKSFKELEFDDLFEYSNLNNDYQDLIDNDDINPTKNIICNSSNEVHIKTKPITIIQKSYFPKNNDMFNTPINKTPNLSDGFILINTPVQNKNIISKSKLGNTLFDYMDNSYNYFKSFFIN